MYTYLAAVIQMNSQPDMDHNFEQAYDLVRKAAAEGARLIGLPENFSYFDHLDTKIGKAEQLAEASPAFLKKTASEFGIYLLGGSYPVPDKKGKMFNRSTLFDPGGNLLAQYDKIHLFDVDLPEGEKYRESDFVRSGMNSPVVISTNDIGRIGFSICYDLRFPELYRALSDIGAEIMTVPSAFTATTGRVHWEPLIRARAIENTTYLFAPAQTGVHGKKRRTHGHSMIVDPWGDVLAIAGTGPGIACAEIRSERLEEVRKRIPSLEHRIIGHERPNVE